ncbi:MAG: TetR/AcrR family transcriptional regulator [Gammaproteobacteria bacterium]|nr:TetR/AcrR family transcriptional regulator [Gammaproteobacteria bacterium]
MELFAERGFDAVPLSAVAERAGVSKGNIFHHFGSKDGLYLAVMKQASGNTARLLAELTRGTGTFADRIHHFAGAHLDYLMRNQCVARLILRELAQGDAERGRRMVEGAFGGNFATLVSIFRSGQRDGHVRRELDPAVMALGLLAGNVFYFQSQFLLPHLDGVGFAGDPGYYCTSFVDIFLRGVLTVES